MQKTTRRAEARFIVGTPDGPRSSVWKLWTTKNDVYVVTSNLGSIQKISFHPPDICRWAFTKEHGTPAGMSDRAMLEWRRIPTPALGSGQGSCVLEVTFPTNYLSAAWGAPNKPAIWIKPASLGMATVLEMIFISETEKTISEAIGVGRVVWYRKLPNREAFVVIKRQATFEGESFYVPASHHAAQDMIFLTEDPDNTGRPMRMNVFSNPKHGDRLYM